MAQRDGDRLVERLAGAGTGTTLVGLVNSLPNDFDPYRSAAVYFCPVIGVIVGAVWAYFLSHAKKKIAINTMKTSVSELRKIYKDAENNGVSSQSHLTHLLGQIEELETVLSEAISSNAKGINVSLNH